MEHDAPDTRPPKRPVAGWLGVALLLASVIAGVRVEQTSGALKTPHAPQGMLSLELPRSDAVAAAIVRDWSCPASATSGDCVTMQAAVSNLRRDYLFILTYTLAWSLLALWAGLVCGLSWLATLGLMTLIVGAGFCDSVENALLATQLGILGQMPPPASAGWVQALTTGVPHAAGLTRAFSMTKFVLLILGVFGVLAAIGGAWRLIGLNWHERRSTRRRSTLQTAGTPKQPPPDRLEAFKSLIAKEDAGIFFEPKARSRDHPLFGDNKPADEPWICFRAADIIGLALSGGGIRSATFNLGLLQGLHRLKMLPLFDYLSTVSGGGYVGSFWSAWLVRHNACKPDHPDRAGLSLVFPSRDQTTDGLNRTDSDPERHLREFSKFLAPRWGFLEVETWTALVAVLSGLLPALVLAFAVIGGNLIAWLALSFPLACRSAAAPLPVIGLLTIVAFTVFEYLWQSIKASGGSSAAGDLTDQEDAQLWSIEWRYYAIAGVSLVFVLLIQYALPWMYLAWLNRSTPLYVPRLGTPAGLGPFERWWQVAGIVRLDHDWMFSPRLFDFGVAWLAAAIVLVFLRVGYSIWPWVCKAETLASFDRVLMRLLALGTLWCGLALLWHLAINIGNLTTTMLTAALTSGTFAALRNWMGLTFRRGQAPGLWDRVKVWVPPILAYLTIALAAAALGQLLIRLCQDNWIAWAQATAVIAGVLVLGLFIDPGEFGLHAFYRQRISRAYSGASNLDPGKSADDNRATESVEGDDIRLTHLVSRPLHLVCCAANDLTGDPVETLSRGARSAVLSKYGLSLGRYCAEEPELRLSSAITASAAAFNSNMGAVSMALGPAVSFLMTALNLRLGLWLRHPEAEAATQRRWPGLLLYREMFGLTSASGALSKGVIPLFMRDVHLSDGGHFENLALYELIRRHCRYVLVSDCGADPELAFDDLGNAFRRVREDFGVDVSLDIAPLQPGPDGRSRQHVAVGTIQYSPTDRGILLYVKPTLTGDEPPDVLQYKTRNRAFPHEDTADQFYGEAQWESYRRLGLHAAEKIFDFVQPVSNRQGDADWIFGEAIQVWGGTPPGLADRVLEMTDRVARLEQELRFRPADGVLAEIFPELAVFKRASGDERRQDNGECPDGEGDTFSSEPGAAECGTTPSELALLLRLTQLMKDIWMACDLDHHWNHPLNRGWVNVFARWATAPAFRRWWPLFSPMFGSDFQRFLEQRFPLPPRPGTTVTLPEAAYRGRVELLGDATSNGATALAMMWWKERSTQPREWEGKTLYQNLLDLPRSNGGFTPVQVGLAAVTRQHHHVGWTSDDFFVPPSLWGAGLGWYFLDALLAELATSAQDCYVVVKPPKPEERNVVTLADRRNFVEQYRKIGFRQHLSQESSGFDHKFAKALQFTSDSTLLVLDLHQWLRRRQGR